MCVGAAGPDWVGTGVEPGAGSVLPLPGLSAGLAGFVSFGGLFSAGPVGGPAGGRFVGGGGGVWQTLPGHFVGVGVGGVVVGVG